MSRVLLICMPFVEVNSPSLGLSLLKAGLARRGIACDIRYLNIALAEAIGIDLYKKILELPTTTLVGEWFFAGYLFGSDASRDQRYCKEVLRRVPLDPVDSVFITDLQRAREQVSSFIEAWLAAIPWECYTIIGFTTMLQQTVASLALARAIKAHYPEKVIVFGGPNCEAEMGIALHRLFPFVDYVCSGDGDVLFPELVTRLLAGCPPDNLPGLIYRRNGRTIANGRRAPLVQDLDALPCADFTDYLDQVSASRVAPAAFMPLLIPMETSRGCWWGQRSHCLFCGLNGLGVAYRSKSPARVLEEIEYLAEAYGRGISVTDNILNLRYFKTLLP